jgi:hypothetical protein
MGFAGTGAFANLEPVKPSLAVVFARVARAMATAGPPEAAAVAAALAFKSAEAYDGGPVGSETFSETSDSSGSARGTNAPEDGGGTTFGAGADPAGAEEAADRFAASIASASMVSRETLGGRAGTGKEGARGGLGGGGGEAAAESTSFTAFSNLWTTSMGTS